MADDWRNPLNWEGLDKGSVCRVRLSDERPCFVQQFVPDKNEPPNYCSRFAEFFISGQLLCRRHAEVRALEIVQDLYLKDGFLKHG